MARKSTIVRLPKIGRHSSGQARITLNGKVHYLGPWGSIEAQRAYTELLTRWEANGRQPLDQPATVLQVRRIRDLFADYLAHGWTRPAATTRTASRPPSGKSAGSRWTSSPRRSVTCRRRSSRP
jgi:hypothetical protein